MDMKIDFLHKDYLIKIIDSPGAGVAGDLILYPESQTKQFQDFLTRANRYPSLMVGGASGGGVSNQRSKKIVLVEVNTKKCYYHQHYI